MATFRLHSASKAFGSKELLTDISFSLRTGEILGLFGRNGCGKSTLLKMIFGTLKADAINISIDKTRFCPSQNIANQNIAYLPQHSFLPKNTKVRNLVPIYFKEEEKQDAVFYDPLIATLAAKNIGDLSLGQRRYFEVLLIANLNHPFMMLDEPFSMIEPLYKIHIRNLLNKVKSNKGILITDHYYNDVIGITSQNILIKNGISEEINSKDDLKVHGYLGKNSI